VGSNSRAVRAVTREAVACHASPWWDAPREQLLVADCETGEVLAARVTVEAGFHTERLGAGVVGVAALAATVTGDILLAAGDRVHTRAAGGALIDGPVVVPDPLRRVNAGAPDPEGRFVIGTASSREDPMPELLILLGDGGSDDELEDTDVVLVDDAGACGGITWSPDGMAMYSVDSQRGVIGKRPWLPGNGPIGARHDWVHIDEGTPLGIAADLEGGIWVAIDRASRLERYSPTGHRTDVIELDAAAVGSVTFAGPSLSTLVVAPSTRARGPLLAIEVEVPGAPCTPWSGRV